MCVDIIRKQPNKFNSDEWYTNDISWMVAYKSKKRSIGHSAVLRFTIYKSDCHRLKCANSSVKRIWNWCIGRWAILQNDYIYKYKYKRNEEKEKKPIRLFIYLFISVCFVSARLLGKCWLNKVFVFLSSFCFMNNALEIFIFSFVF